MATEAEKAEKVSEIGGKRKKKSGRDEVELTKNEIVLLYRKLSVASGYVGSRFCYALAKSVQFLEQEAKAIEKAINISLESRRKIQEEHSKRDSEGKIIKDGNGAYVFIDQAAADKEINEFDEKHGLQKLLNEEVTIRVHRIPYKLQGEGGDVPDDLKSDDMMAMLKLTMLEEG